MVARTWCGDAATGPMRCCYMIVPYHEVAYPAKLRGIARVVVVALLTVLLFGNVAEGGAFSGCAMPGTRLLAESPANASERGGSLVAIDPGDGGVTLLPVDDPLTVTPVMSSGFAIVGTASGQDHLVRLETGWTVPIAGSVAVAVTTTRSLVSAFRSPRWTTLRTRDAAGLRIRVRDRERHRIVIDATFPRRIEIAATATSADGRTLAYLQANNVASELTLFDAAVGTRRDLTIPHDAVFAAYAVTLVFSPDGTCLAVSMDRYGRPPGSWTIDPRRPDPAATPIGDIFVLGWIDVPDHV